MFKPIIKIENFEIGEIMQRINKFVVKVRIRNKITFAHLNNTGRLEEFVRKGRIGIFLPIKGRKTKFRLSMIKENSYASIIDTSLQMKSFEIALEKGYLSWFRGVKILKRNFKIIDTNGTRIENTRMGREYIHELNTNTYMNESQIDKTRMEHEYKITNDTRIDYTNETRINKFVGNSYESLIDYLIEYKNKFYLVEIKSAVMKKKNLAMYPDCPSIRGQKHIKALINMNGNQLKNIQEWQRIENMNGNEFNKRITTNKIYSMIVFIAGMKNINAFTPNKDADPKIYELLKEAKRKGVKIKAIQIYFDLRRKEVILKNDNLKVIL